MDVGRESVDGVVGETLIDLALEVGYRMGATGESFSGDSREAVELIRRRALEFEVALGEMEDYMEGVQVAAERCYWELRMGGMVGAD